MTKTPSAPLQEAPGRGGQNGNANASPVESHPGDCSDDTGEAGLDKTHPEQEEQSQEEEDKKKEDDTLVPEALKNLVASIPVEVVAVWTFFQTLFYTAQGPQTELMWISFWFTLIFVPGWTYVTIQKEEKTKEGKQRYAWAERTYQCLSASLAFTIWAFYLYSVSAPVGTVVHGIVPNIPQAQIAVIGFSFAIPIIPVYVKLVIEAWKKGKAYLTAYSEKHAIQGFGVR